MEDNKKYIYPVSSRDYYVNKKFKEEYETSPVDRKLMEEICGYRIEISRLNSKCFLLEKEMEKVSFENNQLTKINKELTKINKELIKKNELLQTEVDKIHSRFDILDLR